MGEKKDVGKEASKYKYDVLVESFLLVELRGSTVLGKVVGKLKTNEI